MADLTNRILTVGLALVAIFLFFLVILLAWGAPDQSIDLVFDLAGYLEDNNSTEAKLIITFGGIILMLLATLLIIFEVVPSESNALVVSRASTGDAQIDAEEVVMRIEDELRLLPQISQVQATVAGRGKKAEVELSLHVTSDADLAATVDEACQRTRALMEDRMGLELSRPPQAEIHYRELRVGQQAAATRQIVNPPTPTPADPATAAPPPAPSAPSAPPPSSPTSETPPASNILPASDTPPATPPESDASSTANPSIETGNDPAETTEADRPADT